MAASIIQIQQSVEKKEGELMVYVSIVNTNVIKAQGDNKHQFSRAIQLAIAKAHQELKRLIAAQRSQLQQAQDLAKELSKCHSRTLKNFGSKDEVQRLIEAELEMLKHRIEGMKKVEADISSETQQNSPRSISWMNYCIGETELLQLTSNETFTIVDRSSVLYCGPEFCDVRN
jgi:hypothetical protein